MLPRACVALAILQLASATVLAQRSREAAVVEYKEFVTPWAQSHFKALTKPTFDAVAERNLAPEWVLMDLFLLRNTAERNRYKRIVLSSAACWFTPEMYEGMLDYVRSGGLLIVNTPLGAVDRNSNRRLDKLDKWMVKPGNKIVGAYGVSNGSMTKTKTLTDCPLTRDLPRGDWAPLKARLTGRTAQSFTATPVVLSDFIRRKKRKRDQPMLLYKRAGKGACVYIVPRLCAESLKEPHVRTILTNALSPETLKWLTSP